MVINRDPMNLQVVIRHFIYLFLVIGFILYATLSFASVTDKSKYTIYITFDDGPLLGSNHIHELILRQKIKANMFLIGKHIDSPQLHPCYLLYRRNPYIDIYNHSYCHANENYYQFYKHPKLVIADIIKSQYKYNMMHKIVRLPGRNIWRIGPKKRDDTLNGSFVADSLVKLGYTIFGWDIEWQHRKDGSCIQTPQQLYYSVKSMLQKSNRLFQKDHLVLLIHDQMFLNKQQIKLFEQFINLLSADNNIQLNYLRFYPKIQLE